MIHDLGRPILLDNTRRRGKFYVRFCSLLPEELQELLTRVLIASIYAAIPTRSIRRHLSSSSINLLLSLKEINHD